MARLAPRLALRSLAAQDPCFAVAGERLAERALRARGWRLLGRRVKTRWGELDLLFVDGQELVVIEVKTGRAGARFGPGLRFGRAALAQRWRAARALAGGRKARVDLIEVALDTQRNARLVHHADLRRPL